MRLGLALLVLSSGCVSGPRALGQSQLESYATRRHQAPFDEVFDATVLSLGRMGLTIEESDVKQGTIVAKRRDGTGYSVSIQSRDDEQLVVAVPTPERAAWVLQGEDGESARWDRLESYTNELLTAWRDHPEWAFIAARNLLGVLSFYARVPQRWERVDPSVSRRVTSVQRFKTRRGLNPTILFEVKRRTPALDARAFLLTTAEVALQAKGRLTWVGDDEPTLREGRAQRAANVLDGTVPRQISWHLWDHRTPTFTVRVAAVCGAAGSELDCDDDWEALVNSIVAPGFEPAK
ncbi:MAG: hypothetical protein GQE15_41650 [Archangiaceae bacterium]|nr:hypothetical protein [Archangiaceae bacterium]